MNSQSTDSRSQSFRQQTYIGHHLLSHLPIGTEDPALVEEAQHLLSKFMRHSSYRKERVREDSSTLPSQSMQYRPAKSEIADNGKVRCAVADESTHETSSKQHHSLTRKSSVGRLYDKTSSSCNRTGPSQKTAYPLHSKSATKPTEQASNLYETWKGPSKSHSPCQSNKIPTMNNKNPSKSDRDLPTGNRRSGRSRNGPVNYYKKLHLSRDSEEEEDDDDFEHTPDPSDHLRQDDSRHLPSSPENTTNEFWARLKHHVVYSSPNVQIFKSAFSTLDELGQLEHASYLSQYNLADCVQKYQSEEIDTRIFIHVDFDHNEMAAILKLLCFFCNQSASRPEINRADRIIQLAQNNTATRHLGKKISYVYRLFMVLEAAENCDAVPWLLEAVASTSQERNKLQSKSKRLVAKILGAREKLSPDSQVNVDEAIHKLSDCLSDASTLRRRKVTDIDSFLANARRGCLPSVPSVITITPTGSKGGNSSACCIEKPSTTNRVLLRRELGCRVERQLRSIATGEFNLFKTWKGCSNDVNVLAWSPDGTQFAAGATALCDPHNMDYNAPNNLVMGDLTKNLLEELPDHWISRPPGANTMANDIPLFMTITGMQWFDDTLFTSSYDKTVKLWNFPRGKALCHKTLTHDSKVQVMARSNFEDLLAVGADSIGLWNLNQTTHTPLEFSMKRGDDMIPTSLAWGSVDMTKNILLAGLSEKDDGVAQNGLLAGWVLNEASAIPLHMTPNSQNIFDIKWHPKLPFFATASSVGNKKAQLASRDTRSVVRIYEPLSLKMSTLEFECPALDINDITFCPINSIYVTASCTDGITYVWDWRNPSQVLHKLQHGFPLNPIDEMLPREQADVGVRMASWGMDIDQFYTGGSDGVLKRWNILKSPEDVLVNDIINLQGGIMCGALSEDKTNMLVGDSSGALHVLSKGSSSKNEDLSINFREAAQMPCSQDKFYEESGVLLAQNYLSSRRLVRHPTYGVGQGPCYDGPFAAWARPDDTPMEKISQTSLKEDLQRVQLDGPPLQNRPGLDKQGQRELQARIQLSRIRNQKRNQGKRKREKRPDNDRLHTGNVVDLCSDEDYSSSSTVHKQRISRPLHPWPTTANVKSEVIDLTGESDEEVNPSVKREPVTTFRIDPSTGLEPLFKDLDLEDDFWWPESDMIDPNFVED